MTHNSPNKQTNKTPNQVLANANESSQRSNIYYTELKQKLLWWRHKIFFFSQFMRAPYSLILDNFEFLHTSSHSISLTINVPVL